MIGPIHLPPHAWYSFSSRLQLRSWITAPLLHHSSACGSQLRFLHHSFAFASQLCFCITASLLHHACYSFAFGSRLRFGSHLCFWITASFLDRNSVLDHSFAFGSQLCFWSTAPLWDHNFAFGSSACNRRTSGQAYHDVRHLFCRLH